MKYIYNKMYWIEPKEGVLGLSGLLIVSSVGFQI